MTKLQEVQINITILKIDITNYLEKLKTFEKLNEKQFENYVKLRKIYSSQN